MLGYTPAPQGQGDSITTASWNRLREGVQQLLRLSVGPGLLLNWVRGAPVISALPPLVKVGIITSASITGRTGKTAGFGMVQPYSFDGTTFVIQGSPVKVFNWTGSVITGPVWVKYMEAEGRLMLNGQDCSGVTP